MSRESATLRGRAMAERGMVDECVIERATGETTGPGGHIVTTYGPPIYDGRCTLQVPPQSDSGQGSEIGEAYRLIARRELKLPMSAPQLREGDRVTMTASLLDPLLPGKQFTVRDMVTKTFLTTRRVTVIEVTS